MFETKENILTKLFEKLKGYAENYQLTNPLEFHSWCKNLYLRDLGFQTRSFLIEDFDGVYDIYICQMTNKMEIQIKFDNLDKSLKWRHEHRGFKNFVYEPDYAVILDRPCNDAFYDREGHLQLTYDQYERLAKLLGLKVAAREDDTVFGFIIPNIQEIAVI